MSEPRSVVGPIAIASGATSLGVLPVFLLAALAVFMRSDMGFTESALGTTVALFFASSAAGSVPMGRLSERIGASRTMVLGAILTGLCLGSIGLLATRWAHLALAMAIGGLGNATAHLASNLSLARVVVPSRQGLAFGIKQASIPVASFVAGVSVPALGVTAGWRPAFVAAAIATVLFAVTVSRTLGAREPAVAKAKGAKVAARIPTLPLTMLAIGVGCGAAAMNSMGAFLVEFGVATGLDAGDAGRLLAFGSVAGVMARILIGWQADLRPHARHLLLVAGLLAAGAVSFGLFGLSGTGPLLLVATVLAYGAGWGWSGLFFFAVVRLNPEAPAAATGVTMGGIFVGGVLGPAGFGMIVERFGYTTAWLVGALILLTGSAFIAAGRATLLAARGRGGPDGS